jgi:hypothetical protein
MDHFRQQGYNTPDLCRLNRCRLYLQVARISDIATIAGTHIYAHVFDLEREKQTEGEYTKYPSSRLAWPQQARPGMKARKLWAKSIQNTLLQANGRLQTTLGKWNCHIEARDRQYPTLYHENHQILYQFDGNAYYQLPIHKTSRRHIHATIDALTRSTRTPGYPASCGNFADLRTPRRPIHKYKL